MPIEYLDSPVKTSSPKGKIQYLDPPQPAGKIQYLDEPAKPSFLQRTKSLLYDTPKSIVESAFPRLKEPSVKPVYTEPSIVEPRSWKPTNLTKPLQPSSMFYISPSLPPSEMQWNEQAQAIDSLSDVQEGIKSLGRFGGYLSSAFAHTLLNPIMPPEQKMALWEKVRQSGEEAPLDEVSRLAQVALVAYGGYEAIRAMPEIGRYLKSYGQSGRDWLENKLYTGSRALDPVTEEELSEFYAKGSQFQQEVMRQSARTNPVLRRAIEKVHGAGSEVERPISPSGQITPSAKPKSAGLPSALPSPPPSSAIQTPQIRPENLPSEPFVQSLAKIHGDQAVFFFPGYGLESGTSRMAGTAKKMGETFGLTTQNMVQALDSSAKAYQKALGDGLTPEQALDDANAEFWRSVPVQSVVQRLGIFQNDPEMALSFTQALQSGDQPAIEQFMETLLDQDPELASLFPNIQAQRLQKISDEEALATQEVKQTRLAQITEREKRKIQAPEPAATAPIVPAKPPLESATRTELTPAEKVWAEMPFVPAKPPQVKVEPDVKPSLESGVLADTSKFPVKQVSVGGIQTRPKDLQFKLDVNASGEQKALQGEFNELAAGNLLLWQSMDGTMYVANGHHRLAHARRTGQKYVNAQILKESDGFTVADARSLAAESNILEGKGTIYDHAEYFRLSQDYTESLAEKKGIAGQGYAIGRFATDNTYAQFRNRKISPDHAEAIALSAQNNDALQLAGVNFSLKNSKADAQEITNFVNALNLEQKPAEQLGMFEQFDDSALRNAEEKAKVVSRMQIQIREQINAVRGSAKRPEIAKSLGVDVTDPEGVLKKVAELTETSDKLKRWYLYPEIVQMVEVQVGGKEPLSIAESKAKLQKLEEFRADAIDRESARTVEEKAAKYQTAQPFYSGLQKLIQDKMPERAFVSQVKSIIQNAKKEEVDWSGIDQFLEGKQMVSKKDVLDFLKQNEVQVKEVMKGVPKKISITEIERELERKGYYVSQGKDFRWHITNREGAFQNIGQRLSGFDTKEELLNYYQDYQNAIGEGVEGTKFSKFQLPGGENYRELLLTLPTVRENVSEADVVAQAKVDAKGLGESWDELGPYSRQRFKDAVRQRFESAAGFRGGHFEEPNVLAHVRFNDRTDAQGNKILFIEEIQSDWMQKGREKGFAPKDIEAKLDQFYKGIESKYGTGTKIADLPKEVRDEHSRLHQLRFESVPNAPFKKTWHELVLKRMLRYAAENDYDKIAWTTGSQQNARYDLSKQLDRIEYFKNPDGKTYDISGWKDDNKVLSVPTVPGNELADTVGKEIANRITNGEGNEEVEGKDRIPTGVKILKGKNLEVGGEGMKGFYNQMIPSFLNKYAKKWGRRVGETELDLGGFSGSREDFAKGKGEILKEKVHSLDITPSMRSEVVERGQPLFEKQEQFGLPGMPKSEMPSKGLESKKPQAENLLSGFEAPKGTQGELSLESKAFAESLPSLPDFVRESPITSRLVQEGTIETTSIKIESPSDIASMFYHLKNSRVENFYAVMLDENGNSLGASHLSMGTEDQAIVSMSEIFAVAQKSGAKKIVLVHNHPSGSVLPSKADIDLTEKVKRIGEHFGIRMDYHVVIDHGKFGVVGNDLNYEEVPFTEPAARPVKIPLFKTEQMVKTEGIYDRMKLTDPAKVFQTFKDIFNAKDDTIFAVVLNTQNQVNGVVPIAEGGIWGDKQKMDALRRSVYDAVINHSGTRVMLVSGGENLHLDLVRRIRSWLGNLNVELLDAIFPNRDFKSYTSTRESYPDIYSEEPKGKFEVREPGEKPSFSKFIMKAQAIRNKLGIDEEDWRMLKVKATRKQSLTQMNETEIRKVIDVLRDIQGGKYALKDYIAGTYEFKTPPVPPGPPPIDDIDRFFGQDEPFPEIGLPKKIKKIGFGRKLPEFFGVAGSRQTSLEYGTAGELGKALIKEAKQARNLPTIKAGGYNNALERVGGKANFSKEERFNILDSLEGRAKPTERTREFFEVADKQRNEIRDLTQKHIDDNPFQLDLEIKRKEKEKWGLKNYFHHQIPDNMEPGSPMRAEVVEGMMRRKAVESEAKANKMIDEWIKFNEERIPPQAIIEYLIKTGQAANFDDALVKLDMAKRFNQAFKEGAFLRREVDLPFYDPNPLRVIPQYNRNALRYLYSVHRFGDNAEKLIALAQKIDLAGGNKEIADAILDSMTGKQVGLEYRDVAWVLRNIQIIQLMSFSALSNFWQGGLGTTLAFGPRVFLKSRAYIKSQPARVHSWAVKVGQNPDFALLWEDDLGDITKWFLEITRFRGTERNNYVMGTVAGKFAAVTAWSRLKKNPKDSGAREILKWLELDPDKILNRGYLTRVEVQTAGNYGWRKTQAIPETLNLPHRFMMFRTDTPEGRLLFQFLGVAFGQTRLVWERAIKEASKGRIAGLLTLLIIFPIIGTLIKAARTIPTGKWEELKKWSYLEAMSAAFGFGMLETFFWSSRFGKLPLGPTLSQAAELLGAGYQVGKRLGQEVGAIPVKKKKQSLGYLNLQARRIPIAGPFLYNRFLKQKKGAKKPNFFTSPLFKQSQSNSLTRSPF